MTRNCAACGKRLGRNPTLVTGSNGLDYFVGSECAKQIRDAKQGGWISPSGAALYSLKFDPKGKPTTREIGARADRARQLNRGI